MWVFVTGGTGMVGVRLIRALRARGDDVVVLSRRPDAYKTCGTDCHFVTGEPTRPGPWQSRVAECDAVVHLAGANVLARRWTDAYKAELHDSRVHSADCVVEALAAGGDRPKVLVCASAVGYYGPRGDEPLTEGAPAGGDFLARLCVDWELAAKPAEDLGARVVLLRTGVVLDRAGGALAAMSPMFKMFLGGRLGSGKQWLSWIHHADLTGLYLFAIDQPHAHGPVNATAPDPVTNAAFAKAMGRALNRPSAIPAPSFALKAFLGERAGVLLSGQRVLPERAQMLGYHFRYPGLEQALHHATTEPLPDDGSG
jgi:uncharacterized protein (TIGR01777 family)